MDISFYKALMITKYRSRPRDRLRVHSLNEPAGWGIDTTISHMLGKTADEAKSPGPHHSLTNHQFGADLGFGRDWAWHCKSVAQL